MVIESKYDIDEEDVEAVYRTLELTRDIISFAESKEDHKSTFDTTQLRRMEQQLNGLWQTLSLVVASQRDVTAHDLMEDMANE